MSRRRTRSDQAAGVESARVGGAPAAGTPAVPEDGTSAVPEDGTSAVPEDGTSGVSGAASPVVVFVALVALLALITGVVYVVNLARGGGASSAEAPESTARTSNLSLTDEEAIERLGELDRLRIEALEQRDISLLDEVFTPTSPAAKRVKRSIRTLLKDRVRLEQRQFDVRSSQVLTNSDSEIRIRQVVVVHIEFTNPKGERLTKGSGRERQVVIRTLKPVGAEWFFYDGRIVDADPI